MPTFADDHAEISNLLARYCVLLDQDDVDAWVDLFTPDATYHVYGRAFKGHDGLRKMMSGAPGGLHLGRAGGRGAPRSRLTNRYERERFDRRGAGPGGRRSAFPHSVVSCSTASSKSYSR